MSCYFWFEGLESLLPFGDKIRSHRGNVRYSLFGKVGIEYGAGYKIQRTLKSFESNTCRLVIYPFDLKP